MNLTRIYARIQPLVEFIFPVECESCGEPIKSNRVPYFCNACWQKIEPVRNPSCPGCGKPFKSTFALAFSPEHRCGDCRAPPFHFDGLVSPFRYEGALSLAIGLFKYGKKMALAPHLTSLVLPFLDRFKECGI